MEKLNYIIFIIFLAGNWSCKNDPWLEIEKGNWNQERTVLDIKFQGQAGPAIITSEDAATGTIELALAVDMIDDLSKVTIEKLTLSYKATSTVNAGETVDFLSGNPSFTITSFTGKSRTYTIIMSEFTEDLIGMYDVHDLYIYGGTGPEYGGGACLKPNDKPWCWNQSGEGPDAEIDNSLEFIMTEILDNGNTTGICIHDAGNDKKYWDCIFAGSQNKEGTENIDLNKFYRQIPIGESVWIRDYSAGTITFKDPDGKTTVGQLMDQGTYNLYGDNIKLAVPNQAFKFALNGTDDWTNIFSDYDKFVKKPRSYYMLIRKR